ncbi:MAG: site-2 protease family protein, partial [Bacteroidota bacterium]
MSGLIMAIQMIAALSLLVILHEFGHYIAARIFGIRVEKFYLFFNPKFSLLTYNKKTGIKFFVIHKGDKAKNEKEKEQDEQAKEYCTYGIGWLPVGGYVKIAGMIDESMDTEAMKKPPQPYEFRSKPRWQRLIVMTAGVIMNLILGIVVLSIMLLVYTKSYLPKDEVNRHGIYSYQMGRDMGFQTGDKILKINGDDFDRFEEVLSTRVLFGADLTIERDGREMIITTPDTLYKAFKKSAAPFISANNFPFVVDSIVDSTGAWTAGVMPGDKIVSINGEPIDCFGELNELLLDNKGKEISLVVFR